MSESDSAASAAFVPGPRLQRAGATDGPLRGLSFAAKDLFDVAGEVTGAGNPDWARTHGPAERTAAAIERLLAAGAELAGKTVCDELAFSLNGRNVHYGTPKNAAAPERTPGGSSSGSAAAVAGGEVDFALGTDTGGSVRVPASYCGLWGIRTTHGRLSHAGLQALAPSYDTVGWFAREAAVLRRVGEVLLDEGPLDSFGREPTRPLPERIHVASDAFARVEPEARASLDDACRRLVATLGCRVDTLAIGQEAGATDLGRWFEHFRVAQGREVWQTHGQWYEATRPAIDDEIDQRLRWTRTITAEQASAARAAAAPLRARARELVGRRSVICLPTTPGPAPRLDVGGAELLAHRGRLLELTAVAGLGGLPQVNLPICAPVDEAPVGLSLIGPAGADRWLLGLAERLAAG